MHTPHLQRTWRAPSVRTALAIGAMVIGGCGVVTFAAFGLLVDHVPRTADVPRHGVLGSLALFGVGLGLLASVPRMTIDLERHEVRRGSRVVADLSRCRAVMLRQVEQRMVGQAGGTMTASWWVAAVVLDASAPGVAAAATEDILEVTEVVELMRGVPRPRAEGMVRALAAALDRPVVVVDADGRVSV